jgi:ketosteroid isomerase-like protein
MASQEVELVHAMYAGSPEDWVAAFADASFMKTWTSALEPVLDPDFEIAFVTGPSHAGLAGLEGTYRGIDGFQHVYRDWLQAWETYRVRLERVIDLGTRVVALSEWGGRSKTGGVELFQPGADLWTFRDLKVKSLEAYLHRDDAMKAIKPALEGG